MTPTETKFILRAHRTDGRYAPDDLVFRDALGEAERSPELTAWLAREHALDETVARQLEGIQPPAGLRDTILAGGRASCLHRPAWRQPRWLALAATIAIAAAIPTALQWARPPALSAGAFAHLAVEDYATRKHVHAYGPRMNAVTADLSQRTTPLTAGLDLSPETLRAANCAVLKLGGSDVYEVCFEHDGTWFHLYVTKRDSAGTREQDRRPVFLQQEQIATASWTDGAHLYALVTWGNSEALKKIV